MGSIKAKKAAYDLVHGPIYRAANRIEMNLKNRARYALGAYVRPINSKLCGCGNPVYALNTCRVCYDRNRHKPWGKCNREKRRLENNLRRRITRAIQQDHKNGSAIRDLGCSIDEFKIYLSFKFQSGMTWENWGPRGWHIDHIKPLASFDLKDRTQFLEACHYTNLQPLWWQDNLKKGYRIPVTI